MLKRFVSLLLIMSIICFAGCGEIKNSSATTKTIIDLAGDEVEIPLEVNSVINLVAYGCQMMIGLNCGDYLIGINEETVESPWIVEMYPNIENIEKYNPEASAEVLLKANADVVIVETAEKARELRNKGITAVTLTFYSIDEMKECVCLIGNIVNETEKTDRYIDYLEGNINLVKTQLDGRLPQKESLYYINGVSNKGLYKTTGKGSTNWACANLSYTIFATEDLIEAPENRVDSEALLAVNPENVIIGGVYQHILYDELMSNPEWKNTTAIKNGNIFKVPMGISAWNRYGLEIALMIPWTSSVVYPEYFNYDVVKETIKFYETFAGYTLTETQAQYILDGLTPDGVKEIAN